MYYFIFSLQISLLNCDLFKMADRMAGVLTSATSVLKRAVELDTKGRYGEAVICYQEGLQLLMDVLKGMIRSAS